MSELATRTSALPAVQSRQDLEALSDADLWTFAERATQAGQIAWEIADQRLHQWVEVEGLTSRQIGQKIGRDQSRVVRRCATLGISFSSGRGGSRKSFDAPASNDADDYEEVDAEVVEDDEENFSQPVAAPDPGPAVRCPTCGHMVRADDIQTWKE